MDGAKLAAAAPDDAATIGLDASARPPVGILAALLAVAVAVVLAWSGEASSLRFAVRYLRPIAPSPAPVKVQNLTFQRAALASGDMLPIYGSSELYCCGNPYRAAQLFRSEPTGFDAFSVGSPGMSNLLFLQTFGALGRALNGKKVVIFNSPSWFSNGPDVDAQSYAGNFSPEIASVFIFGAPISLRLREAAARRMLAHPDTLADQPLLRAAVRELADPTPLHLAMYFALAPLGRLEAWVGQIRDAWETWNFLRHHSRSLSARVSRRTRLDWVALAARATKAAERRDSTNPFGFPNRIYRRLKRKGELDAALSLYRSGSSNRDGLAYPPPTDWEATISTSAEWDDLQLAAAVLHELGAEPFVWSIPMAGFYHDYTILSAPARQAYYTQWERIMEQAGVPWLDFRADDEDPYFLTDPGAHFSPRGWIFADRALDMFWHGESIDAIRAALATLAEQVPAPGAAIVWERRPGSGSKDATR